LAYKIGLSDGSVFVIKTSYLSSIYQDMAVITRNRVLSNEEEEAFRFAGACFEAEQSALRLTARAEQTGFGLTAKLKRRGHCSEAVQAVVSRLKSLEILSDSRYARLWLWSRLSRKEESPRRLITALCSRGIDRSVAGEALKTVLTFERELNVLKRYMKKNHFSISNIKKSTLQYEGFSAEVIQSLWEDYEHAEG